MALTHAVSTNNYGPAHLIVATSAANGTHTTLATAMADAVSGDTIFLRDSVTENVTLTAGVNIAAWAGGTLNTPTVTGTLTMTAAGTCNISGIRLATNSAALLAVTGSAASIVNLNNCYLNCSNNTGITFSTSNAAGQINIYNCNGDLGTTGIGIFSHSASGTLNIFDTTFVNSGSSLTASTCSAGVLNCIRCNFTQAITTSGTSAITWDYTAIDTSGFNITSATLGGSGVHSIRYSRFNGGTASAASIGSATPVLEFCTIQSSNTNAVTGAGTITYSPLTFEGSSSTVNTSTQVPLKIGPRIYTNGGISFDGGTNLLANYAVGTFTPTMVGSATAGSTTYTVQNGYYVRVGSMVQVQAVVVGSAATGTGNVTLGGLPFTIKNQTQGGVYGSIFVNSAAVWTAATTSATISGAINTITASISTVGTTGANGVVVMNAGAFNFQYTMVHQI